MRKMRELSFGHYFAFAVPVLGAAFGIQYYIRHHHSGAVVAQNTTPMKPAQYKEDTKGARKIASSAGEKDGDRVPHHKLQIESEALTDAGFDTASGDKAFRKVAKTKDDGIPSPELEVASNEASSVGKDCVPIEYRGEGPELTKVTRADWQVVMDQFHGAKSELLGWLHNHRRDFTDETAEAMERQVRNLKIQRPPAADEPDLAWRGIGVFGQGSEAEPMIKMGGGFVSFAIRHPARGKFEMARLVAQAWAPCELARMSAHGGNETWAPVLKCLGVNESQSCAPSSYSESGWAVSSTLAATVSPPGCQIPAFHNPELVKCVGKVSRTVASVEEHK